MFVLSECILYRLRIILVMIIRVLLYTFSYLNAFGNKSRKLWKRNMKVVIHRYTVYKILITLLLYEMYMLDLLICSVELSNQKRLPWKKKLLKYSNNFERSENHFFITFFCFVFFIFQIDFYLVLFIYYAMLFINYLWWCAC